MSKSHFQGCHKPLLGNHHLVKFIPSMHSFVTPVLHNRRIDARLSHVLACWSVPTFQDKNRQTTLNLRNVTSNTSGRRTEQHLRSVPICILLFQVLYWLGRGKGTAFWLFVKMASILALNLRMPTTVLSVIIELLFLLSTWMPLASQLRGA